MANISPNLQSLLDNRLRYLPPLVGDAINSIDWASALIDIGRKFGMHMDEMEDLQAIVLKSMIGLIAPERFEQELITGLALSPANAEKMIASINAKIFEPIHEFVMNGGKTATDPMKTVGIEIEGLGSVANEVPDSPRETEFVPVPPRAPMPDVPQPPIINDDTLVAEKFEDYFMSAPVTTDQSL